MLDNSRDSPPEQSDNFDMTGPMLPTRNVSLSLPNCLVKVSQLGLESQLRFSAGRLLPLAILLLCGCYPPEFRLEPPQTYQLVSNSMASTLWGPHHQVECATCGNRWRAASETYSGDRPIPCFECGAFCQTVGPLPGELVQIDTGHSVDSLARLDLVALTNCTTDQRQPAPDQPDWQCKRLWGLPGERIQLVRGELLVEGQLFQKTPHQFWQVAIPVSSLEPTRPGSHWTLTDVNCDQFLMPKAITEHNRSTGLRLCHGNRLSWSYPEVEGYVLDEYHQNIETPRNLARVTDLLWSIQFSENQELAEVIVRCRYHGIETSLHLLLSEHQNGSLAGSTAPRADGKLSNTTSAVRRAANDPLIIRDLSQLSVGGWDDRLWIITNGGHSKAGQSYVTDVGHQMSPTHLEIEVLNGCVWIDSIKVERDIYLRSSERHPAVGDPVEFVLKERELFVMGDNLPLSIDSRHFSSPVTFEELRGLIRTKAQ